MASSPEVRIVGIDPGSSGAAAIFCPHSIVKVPPRGIIRLPTYEEEKGATSKRRHGTTVVDSAALLGWVQYHQPTHAFIEQVWAMPPKSGVNEETGEVEQRGAGVQSSFNFGRAYQAAISVLECYGLKPVRVAPATWQRPFELVKLMRSWRLDKGEASRQLAMKRHPSAEPFMKFKKDHNSAEALLIAEYGAIRLERENVDDIEE